VFRIIASAKHAFTGTIASSQSILLPVVLAPKGWLGYAKKTSGNGSIIQLLSSRLAKSAAISAGSVLAAGQRG
jgi:hypothetical protein